jgi:uncharacterized protein
MQNKTIYPNFEDVNYKTISSVLIGNLNAVKSTINNIILNSMNQYGTYDIDNIVNIHIGTDSQNSNLKTSFATIVIVHTVGKGARGFYTRYSVPIIRSINERLITESSRSIEFASKFIDIFDEYAIIPSLHADVNPDRKFKSSQIVNEVVGYINAQGYNCITKPDAWVASHVCDHLVKK